MKILHITSAHPRNDTRVYDKIFQTIRQDHENCYLYVADGNGCDHKEGVIDVCNGNATKVKLLKIWHVFRKIKNKRDYILHFHDPELIPIMLLMSLKNTVIFDIHEHFVSRIPERVKSLTLRNCLTYFLKFSVWLARMRFHFILAEDSYADIYKSKKSNTLIRNYPDLSIFKPFKKSKRELESIIKLVYIGSITEERGLSKMLSLLDANKNSSSFKIQLHLIGDGPDANIIKESEYCIKYGRLRLQEAYSIAADCHFGLCLLAPIPNYLNSFPTKILEYNAINLPFFLSDHQYYKELSRNLTGAILVPYDRPTKVIDWLRDFDSHKINYYDYYSANQIKEMLSWESEKKTLTKMYKTLIKS
jgi:hypothetical protein